MDPTVLPTASSDPSFKAISDHLAQTMERLQVPGVALGILHDSHEYVTGFGVTSVEHPLPITGDTLFQIGSITKTLPVWRSGP